MVDPDAMDKEKKAMASTAVSFVSTNDVLASHFFRTCGANVALLCVDFRNTILAMHTARTAQLWGRNHWGTVVYRTPQEATEPWMIRNSLNLLQQGSLAQHLGAALPTSWQFALNNDKVAVASSWVQKDHHQQQWQLDNGTKFMSHVPLYDFSTYAPSGFCVMRTFTYGPKQTGVYVAGDAEMVEQFMSSAPHFLRPLQ